MYTGQNPTGHTSSQPEVNTVQDNFDTDQLDHLISLLLDQRLSEKEEQQLNILLETSPAAVLHYRSVLDTHSALREVFLEKIPTDNCPSPQHGTPQIQTRDQAQDASTPKDFVSTQPTARFHCNG